MKKHLFFLVILALFASCTIYVKEAPPKPRLVLKIKPAIVLVPGMGGIYYVRNYPANVFFFDGRWYIFENSYWYVSQYWKGPFVIVRKVPPGLINARRRMKARKVHQKENKQKKGKGKAKGHGKW